ncbi:Flagellar hook-length control protein FliK [Gaiella occulta]|uniref:Flagellar hook-length control protein FliK n=1 Tax=Gaiella occulta TaxID=1002870 RepID=A0A7M2Z284_9ACTN|nr:flagellar hook-length control protein FliK [Gaiella occulta]RDI75984.1 Flagellar hook-length control protein FliK [Gaiella occulta]
MTATSLDPVAGGGVPAAVADAAAPAEPSDLFAALLTLMAALPPAPAADPVPAAQRSGSGPATAATPVAMPPSDGNATAATPVAAPSSDGTTSAEPATASAAAVAVAPAAPALRADAPAVPVAAPTLPELVLAHVPAATDGLATRLQGEPPRAPDAPAPGDAATAAEAPAEPLGRVRAADVGPERGTDAPHDAAEARAAEAGALPSAPAAPRAPEAAPVAPVRPAPPVPLARVAGELAARMQVASAAGGGEVRLELYPRSLGAVHVHVTVADGVVRGVLAAESREAAETLAQALPDLRRALETGGLTVETLELTSDWQQPGGDRRGGEWARERRPSIGGAGVGAAPGDDRPAGTAPRPRRSGSSAVDVLA